MTLQWNYHISIFSFIELKLWEILNVSTILKKANDLWTTSSLTNYNFGVLFTKFEKQFACCHLFEAKHNMHLYDIKHIVLSK
jgi:hypothetical protein